MLPGVCFLLINHYACPSRRPLSRQQGCQEPAKNQSTPKPAGQACTGVDLGLQTANSAAHPKKKIVETQDPGTTLTVLVATLPSTHPVMSQSNISSLPHVKTPRWLVILTLSGWFFPHEQIRESIQIPVPSRLWGPYHIRSGRILTPPTKRSRPSNKWSWRCWEWGTCHCHPSASHPAALRCHTDTAEYKRALDLKVNGLLDENEG